MKSFPDFAEQKMVRGQKLRRKAGVGKTRKCFLTSSPKDFETLICGCCETSIFTLVGGVVTS